jgi:hypothetical protein
MRQEIPRSRVAAAFMVIEFYLAQRMAAQFAVNSQ